MTITGDSVSDLLRKMLAAKIFLDRDLLRPDYIPDELPHRGPQILRLVKVLAPALKDARPSNIFIYGVPGTGKTAVTKYTLKRLNMEGEGKGISLKIAFVNCKHDDTDYRVLAELCEQIGGRIPFTGLSSAEVYRRFVKIANSSSGTIFVVLDEVDSLIKKAGDEVLYKLTRVNNQLKDTRISIIGITNDLKFTEYLDPRVRSSLGEEELVFPPYNASELEDILRDRSNRAFANLVLRPEVVKLCAALAAKDHGDARRALDLLRVSGELAERDGDISVAEEHVRKAQKEIERDRVVEVVRTMPLHSKLLILSLNAIQRRSPSGGTTGEIYEVYTQITKEFGVDALTQRRVGDLVNELDMLGIANARVVSKGRYGRTKVVSLSISYRNLQDATADDARMAAYVHK